MPAPEPSTLRRSMKYRRRAAKACPISGSWGSTSPMDPKLRRKRSGSSLGDAARAQRRHAAHRSCAPDPRRAQGPGYRNTTPDTSLPQNSHRGWSYSFAAILSMSCGAGSELFPERSAPRLLSPGSASDTPVPLC
jgi:hypothetical protein